MYADPSAVKLSVQDNYAHPDASKGPSAPTIIIQETAAEPRQGCAWYSKPVWFLACILFVIVIVAAVASVVAAALVADGKSRLQPPCNRVDSSPLPPWA
jgi:hypothetical protein